ncbi:MAG: GNAT family N-acetyltransferase, partial [Angelakisella sp.]
KKLAANMGFKAIVIFGRPTYYHRFGFRTAKEFGIQTGSGEYAPAHMVMELHEGALAGISGRFCESSVFELNPDEVEAFDKGFPHKEKMVTPSQKEFEILAAQRI